MQRIHLLRLLVASLVLASPLAGSLSGQKLKDQVQAMQPTLVGKQLYLRDFDGSLTPEYVASGDALLPHSPNFHLVGTVVLESVDLKGTHLVLRGKRFPLLKNDRGQWTGLQDAPKIRIDVNLTQASPALLPSLADQLFFKDLPEALKAIPSDVAAALAKPVFTFPAPTGPQPPIPQPPIPPPSGPQPPEPQPLGPQPSGSQPVSVDASMPILDLMKPCRVCPLPNEPHCKPGEPGILDQTAKSRGLTPPKATHMEDPSVTAMARDRQIRSATSTVRMVVNRSGMPESIWIAHPTGMGLDEEAGRAASHYRFEPARCGGDPVPVWVFVQVNFEIF